MRSTPTKRQIVFDVGSRRTHAQCHNLLDELMPQPLTQNAMGRPSICLRHDQGGVLVGDVKDALIDRHKGGLKSGDWRG
jgi:hypothetical protein